MKPEIKNILVISLFLLVILIFSFSKIVFASDSPPMIVDIEGTIYETDGITPISQSVNISVTNTNTSKIVSGITSLSTPSFFKISASGSQGDNLTLRVWNREHESQKSIILGSSGVIRDESITLNMTFQNYAPDFVSTPITTATERETYNYAIETEDYNFDPVTLTLEESPPSMIIDESSDTLVWTPNQDDVDHGDYDVVIRASDGELSSTQNFTISIINVNNSPVITSYPSSSAKEEEEYSYQIITSDYDNDNLTFSIDKGPAGMTINNSTKILTWTPIVGEKGNYLARIIISDGSSQDMQEWIIFVGPAGNNDPVITSTPPDKAYLGTEYLYPVLATDADGDLLMYDFYSDASSAYVESDGVIRWTPTSDDLSVTPIRFIMRVVDINGGSDTQVFYLNISNATQETSSSASSGRKTAGASLSAGLSLNESKNDYLIINFKEKSVENGLTKLTYYINDETIPEIALFFDKDEEPPKIYFKSFVIKPLEVLSPENLVYKYFKTTLDRNDTSLSRAKIQFKVRKILLETLGLKKEDIVLLRYVNKTWVSLDTRYLAEDSLSFLYEADTPGFSYFAISIKKNGVYPKTATIKESPAFDKSLYLNLTGVIYTKARFIQVDRMTKYKIINNNTKQEYNGYTGLTDKKNPGGYYNLISAKQGDVLIMQVYNDKINLTYEEAFEVTYPTQMHMSIYTNFSYTTSKTFILMLILILLSAIIILSLWLYRRKKLKDELMNN